VLSSVVFFFAQGDPRGVSVVFVSKGGGQGM